MEIHTQALGEDSRQPIHRRSVKQDNILRIRLRHFRHKRAFYLRTCIRKHKLVRATRQIGDLAYPLGGCEVPAEMHARPRNELLGVLVVRLQDGGEIDGVAERGQGGERVEDRLDGFVAADRTTREQFRAVAHGSGVDGG